MRQKPPKPCNLSRAALCWRKTLLLSVACISAAISTCILPSSGPVFAEVLFDAPLPSPMGKPDLFPKDSQNYRGTVMTQILQKFHAPKRHIAARPGDILVLITIEPTGTLSSVRVIDTGEARSFDKETANALVEAIRKAVYPPVPKDYAEENFTVKFELSELPGFTSQRTSKNRSQGTHTANNDASVTSSAESERPGSVVVIDTSDARVLTPYKILNPNQFLGCAQQAYTAAAKIPHVLKQLFCYSGCDLIQNHRTLLDCFTSTEAVDDPDCQMEVALALNLYEQGCSITQIQSAIDAQFERNYPYEEPTEALNTYRKQRSLKKKTRRIWDWNSHNPATVVLRDFN